MNYPFSGILIRQLKAGQSPPISADLELHINLWELDSTIFLDLGIKFLNNETKKIRIDLPYIISKNNFNDLGSTLLNANINSAIFNSRVNFTSKSNEFCSTLTIVDSEPPKSLKIHNLNTNNFKIEKYNLNNKHEASFVEISTPDTVSFEENDYVRIRLTEIPNDLFIKKFTTVDKNLLSSNLIVNILDFRMNALRGVPNELLTIPEYHFPQFSIIHFFCIVPREKELVFEGDSFAGCRSLAEEEVWTDYIKGATKQPNTSLIENSLAYQWTIKTDKTDEKNHRHKKELVTLAKFTETKSSTRRVILVLIMGLLLGCAGNYIYDFLKCDIKGSNYGYISFFGIFIILFYEKITGTCSKYLQAIHKKIWKYINNNLNC